MPDQFTKDLLAFQRDVQVLVRAHEKFDRVWEDGTDALRRYIQEWASQLEDVRSAFHEHLKTSLDKVLKKAESTRYLLTADQYGDARAAIKIMDATLQVMDREVDEYEEKLLDAVNSMHLMGRLGTLGSQMKHLQKLAGLPEENLKTVINRARESVCIEWFTRDGEDWLRVHDPATVDEDKGDEDGQAKE
jgi:hypothetical protein